MKSGLNHSRALPAALLLSSSLLLGACGGDDSTPPTTAPPVPGTPAESAAPAVPAALVVLTPEESARIPSITAELRNGTFSRAVVTKENAKIFLSLAETATDPNILTAALRALPTTWTHSARYADRYEVLTPEFSTVILSRLGHENGQVQAAAMKAAIKCILGDTPNAEVASRLTELATNHATPAGRYEAMEALWNSSVIRNTPAQIAPYVAALDAAEPWLVSGSLFRLRSFGSGWNDQPGLRTKLRTLLTHTDPGVRGRAADALASVVGSRDPERDAVAQAILPLLSDPNPYTRSAAATALASLDYRAAVHAIVPLLNDTEGNTYEIRGYQELDGSNGWSHHDGSAWSRVNDAAVRALQTFSSRVGTRFTFDVDHTRVEADLAAAAGVARTWYQSVRGELPQP